MPSRVTPHSPQSLARIVVTTASCLAIIFVSLHSLYPSVDATFRFLAYILIFNLVPGAVVCRFLLPGVTETGVFLTFSLAAGVLTNILAVTLLWVLGILQYFFLLPVLAGAFALVRLRRSNLSEMLGWAGNHNVLEWIFASAFVCFTALLGISYIYAGLNTEAYTDSYSAHAAFEGIIVRGLELGYPPTNLLFPNADWSYNYAAHLWILGTTLTTGLSVDVLVTRYGPVFLGGASAAALIAFGRYTVGLARWPAYLPVVCVYWIVGIAPISGAIFASFMPFNANLILSPFVAFLVFYLTIAFALEPRGSTIRERCLRFVTLSVLAFLATGARGVCTPILLCGFALRLIASYRRSEGRLLDSSALDLAALLVGFGAGLRFFFTVGASFSGTGTVTIAGQPFTLLASQDVLTLARTLIEWGFAAIPAGMVAFAVIAFFQAAFLTPALPSYLCRMRSNARDVDILLLGCGIAGLSGFFLTRAPELSHVSFLYFSNICFVLLGALALQLMVQEAGPRPLWRSRYGLACLVAIVLLACLQIVQIPMAAVAWIGSHWSSSLISVASRSPGELPRLSPCMREDDAKLFAQAGAISPAGIVIPIYQTTHCPAFWWVVRHPIHTLNIYLLQHVPGRAVDPALQAKIQIQQQRMSHAWEAAAKGILDVADITALAETLKNRAPIFVLAPLALSIERTERLQLVGASDAFGLWRVSLPRDE